MGRRKKKYPNFYVRPPCRIEFVKKTTADIKNEQDALYVKNLIDNSLAFVAIFTKK
jgi:hypothetical protein